MNNSPIILGALAPALIITACSDTDSPVEISKQMYTAVSDASGICLDIQAGKIQAADAAGDLAALSEKYVALKNNMLELDKDTDNRDKNVQAMSEFMNSDEGREMTTGLAQKAIIIAQTYSTTANADVKTALGKFIGR